MGEGGNQRLLHVGSATTGHTTDCEEVGHALAEGRQRRAISLCGRLPVHGFLDPVRVLCCTSYCAR